MSRRPPIYTSPPSTAFPRPNLRRRRCPFLNYNNQELRIERHQNLVLLSPNSQVSKLILRVQVPNHVPGLLSQVLHALSISLCKLLTHAGETAEDGTIVGSYDVALHSRLDLHALEGLFDFGLQIEKTRGNVGGGEGVREL